jgi:hypothetical protein
MGAGEYDVDDHRVHRRLKSRGLEVLESKTC